ncbi:cytochrome P450 [Streptomyces sp. NPDC050485]|uniref:cytochrome P450 n=1 Tax=Streptomyces sp. NPDC050485 TaxID=3365617 RepID=UPI00379BC839
MSLSAAPVSSMNLCDARFLADPHPVQEALRRMGPAVYLTPHRVWAIPRHGGIRRILRDENGEFTADRGITLPGPADPGIQPGAMPAVDREARSQLLPLLARQLGRRAVAKLAEQVQGRADRLVGEHTASGTFDAIVLARELVAGTVMELMGLPEGIRSQILAQASASADISGPFPHRGPHGLPGSAALVPLLRQNVSRGHVQPRSWLGVVLRAVDAGRLAEAEAIPFACAFLTAGLDTTILGLAEAMTQLARHPGQWAELRGDPSLAEWAFHEALRLEAPVLAAARRAVRDVDLDGVRIDAGEAVWLLYGSAGRDPFRWGPTADVFNVHRPFVEHHLAFGSQVHQCAGAPLAVLQAGCLLRALIDHCAGLSLSGEPVRSSTSVVRGLVSSPLAVEAKASSRRCRAPRWEQPAASGTVAVR